MFQSISSIQKKISENNLTLKNLGVNKLFLFGSVAKGYNTENSDIDFIVQFEIGKKNFDNYMDLAFKLEELFLTKVDLITLDSLEGDLKKVILTEVIPFEIR